MLSRTIIVALCAAVLATVGPVTGARADIFAALFQAQQEQKQDAAKADDAKKPDDTAKPDDAKKPDGAVKPDEPKEPAAPPEPLKVIVVGVKGLVQVRMTEDEPWKPAKVGVELSQGAEFRTGPRSAVQLKIPPDQTITLDRLGTMKVLQAVREATSKTIKTDVGLKYGRTRYEIEAAGQNHESTIRAPSSTLAVRGSKVIYQDDALGAFAAGEGRLRFISDLQRLSIAFGGNGVVSKVKLDRPNAGSVARSEDVSDPRGQFAGRSSLESSRVESDSEVGGDDYRMVANLRNQPIDVGARVGGVPFFQVIDLPVGANNALLSVTVPTANGPFTLSAANPMTPDGMSTYVLDAQTGLEMVTAPRALPGNYTITLTASGAPAAFSILQLFEAPNADVSPVVVNTSANPPVPFSPVQVLAGAPYQTTITLPTGTVP